MPNPLELRRMPITVPPYDHQKRAFEFVLRMFGLPEAAPKPYEFAEKKEGDANDSNQ